MQNCIHYFRWTAVLIVVTKSFLTGTKNDKYGITEITRKKSLALPPVEVVKTGCLGPSEKNFTSKR